MLAGIWFFFGIRQSSGWDDYAYLAQYVAGIANMICDLVHSRTKNLMKTPF
jgi:hypothetical protein